MLTAAAARLTQVSITSARSGRLLAVGAANECRCRLSLEMLSRKSTQFRSGALKPKPEEMPFGLVGVFCAVVPGLFIGAAISKSVANFLEENDLFVPEDDDDED